MKKIFIVTSGSYSNYSINAVFDSKELAETFIAFFKKGGCDEMGIEEWELNPHKKDITNGRIPFRLRMTKEGDTIYIEQCASFYGFNEPFGVMYDKKQMYAFVFAKDEQHAIKITNEKRIQLIAENKW